VNQFGQPMWLSQFGGEVVILAFTGSWCTTACSLIAVSTVESWELLGAAAFGPFGRDDVIGPLTCVGLRSKGEFPYGASNRCPGAV
jgi:hypothetical protein